jgi:hypothetical protein
MFLPPGHCTAAMLSMQQHLVAAMHSDKTGLLPSLVWVAHVDPKLCTGTLSASCMVTAALPTLHLLLRPGHRGRTGGPCLP